VHKSFFFVDGGFVALGANLTVLPPKSASSSVSASASASPGAQADADAVTTTTVDARLLSAAHPLVVHTGSKRINASQLLPSQSPHRFAADAAADNGLAWVWHDGVGYENLLRSGKSSDKSSSSSSSSFVVYNANRSGDWSTIGARSGSVNLPVFELGLQHGPGGSGLGADGYAYSVTANTSLADFEQTMSQSQPQPQPQPQPQSQSRSQVMVEVLANDAHVQGIVDARRQQIQAVFWTAGAKLDGPKGGITVDAPCLLLLTMHQNNNSVSIALSSTVAQSVKVTVSCDATSGSKVVAFDDLPTGDALGATVTKQFSCSKSLATSAATALALANYPKPSLTPPHDWSSVGQRVFLHGCKRSGLLNASELELAAKFPVLTVEKGQGEDLPGYAEDKMAAMSAQYKSARPDGWTIFYLNLRFDWQVSQYVSSAPILPASIQFLTDKPPTRCTACTKKRSPTPASRSRTPTAPSATCTATRPSRSPLRGCGFGTCRRLRRASCWWALA
jgi:hypothetical protein